MTMSDTRYDINEAFKPLYTSDKRYYLITGGRGSLKSHSVEDFVVRLTYSRGEGVLFSRYTLVSAEISIIPEFKAAIERLGVSADFEITKQEIINKRTGSYVWFRGLKSNSGHITANLKSLSGITTWVVDEAEDLKNPELFDKVDDSIRTAGKQNRVILIMNPTTHEHWIYERWFKHSNKNIIIDGFPVEVSNHPKVQHIHTTYHIGVNYLSADWLAKAEIWRQKAKQGIDIVTGRKLTREEQDNAIKYYTNNYLGGWKQRAEGVIIDWWEEGEYAPQDVEGFGMDFGFKDPDTMVRVSIDRRNKIIYLKEELYKTNLGTDELVAEIKAVKPGRRLIVAESANPRTIVDIRSKIPGINIVKAIKNTIASDVKELKNWRIIVDPLSVNLKRELNNWVWLDRRGEIPIDAYNHLIDAARYFIMRIVKPRATRGGRVIKRK